VIRQKGHEGIGAARLTRCNGACLIAEYIKPPQLSGLLQAG
jgi:hypothetical protein